MIKKHVFHPMIFQRAFVAKLSPIFTKSSTWHVTNTTRDSSVALEFLFVTKFSSDMPTFAEVMVRRLLLKWEIGPEKALKVSLTKYICPKKSGDMSEEYTKNQIQN